MGSTVDRILVAVSCLYVFICPYTKVEESFNLQAMHDLLYHGTNVSQYDHHQFPGVVPRSFLGPIFVSILSSPFVITLKSWSVDKMWSQYIVRLCLGLLTSYSFLKYKRAVGKKLGQCTAKWLLLITLSQFHFLFYASRPLPNVFALGVALLAIQWWLLQNHVKFLLAAGCAVIVFRGELAILLGLFLLSDLVFGRISLRKLVVCGVPIAVFWLGLTVSVDSIFWRRWLWPEGEVLWFNTVLNKSSEWGTSPFLWYFYSVLPRAMSVSLFLLPVGLYLVPRVRPIVLPALAFVLLFSFLPHKELRFIIYVFPLLNTGAAVCCNRWWQNRWKSRVSGVLAMGVVTHLFVNLLLTSGLLYLSRMNYPGGQAMRRLHSLVTDENVRVHIDVATAQTGVSRFTQINDHWIYDKTEGLEPGSSEMLRYTHLFVGSTSEDSEDLTPYSSTHKILSTVPGFSRVEFRSWDFPPFYVRTEPKIFLLQRKKTLKS